MPAQAVEPVEPPTRSPSSRASRRAMRNESRSETLTHSSTTEASSVSGQHSLPMPSTRYGPSGCSASAVKTEPSGSTATILAFDPCSLK
jgi:hypothetical protein